jgi:hypothetical protein
MCYSLSASINAGVGLGVVGSLLVRKAKRHDQRMIVYAYFPLIYSIHQLIEAVNWYALEKPFEGDVIFRYLYSFIAFGVWPILIPLAAAVAEQRDYWRKFWRLAVVDGVALAGYLWTRLAFPGGIDVSVVKHSLAYKPLFDDPPPAIIAAYVAATTLPSILFRNAAVNVFGWLVFGSFFVSAIESTAAWYSVWCMIAAVSSLSLAFAINSPPKTA